MGDWTGTVPTILAGDIPTGDDWDAITDELGAIAGGWTTYVSTWRSTGTQPALGNGTLSALYRRVGKTVDAQIILTVGSTSTFGTGTYYFDLPVAATRESLGTHAVLDSSAGAVYAGLTLITALAGGPGLAFALPLTASTNAVLTATAPVTFATSDQIRCFATYETS